MVEEFGDIEGSSEGSHLANYKYQYKEETETVEIMEDSNMNQNEKKSWETGKTKASAQNFARNLMNSPSNLMTPTLFAQNVENHLSFLQSDNLSINVRDIDWIKQMKMGCFESVKN